MAGFQLTGLASGFDWKSLVDQMIQVERTPVTILQTEQAKLSRESSALGTLTSKLEALQASIAALKNGDLYGQRTASIANPLWAASAAPGTTAATHTIAVTKLATASRVDGAGDIAQPIRADGDATQVLVSAMNLAQPINAGEFTVNGARVAVAITDTLDEVFQKISVATGGAVTASYDGTSDRVTLAGSGPVILGSANDTSNFLKALKLGNNGSATIESANRLGAARLDGPLASAGLNAAVSGPGTLVLNGTSIAYNADTDSLRTLLARINASNAGVLATYDGAQDRVVLTNRITGDLGVSLQDASGNLGAALGLTGGTLARGTDAEFTIDGGGTLTSSSNTIDDTVHGLVGFAVTLGSETTEVVSVGSDVTTTRTAIEDMIAKYNNVQSYIEEQSKRTVSGTKVTNGLLASDREVTALARSLRAEVFKALSGGTGNISRLDSLGIDFDSISGKLLVKDASKLDTALRTNADGVKEFFTTSSTGFSSRIDALIQREIGTDGGLKRSIDAKTKRSSGIDTQIADIDRRLKEQRSALEARFVLMEQIQSQLQTQLQALTNAFASTSSSTSK